MLKAFKSLLLIGACTLSIVAGTIHQKEAKGQDQSALLTRPQLTCAPGDSHPGLYLKITNNSSNNLAAGTTIRYSYQLSSGGVDGQATMQLSKPLLAGKSFAVTVDGAKRNTFASCTASVVSAVIKIPLGLESRP